MRALLATALLTLAAGTAAAQDFEFELTEQSLNRLVGRLGDPSDGGIHQPNVLSGLGLNSCVTIGTLDCGGAATTVSTVTATAATTRKSGRQQVKLSSCVGSDGQRVIVPASESVAWQWWITDARFLVSAQQLRFAATVVSRVAGQWESEERTVPAALRVDVASQRLRMEVSAFKVPVRHTAGAVSETLAEVDVARQMSFAIPIGEQSFEVRDLEGRVRTLRSRAQGGSVEYLPGKIQVKVDGAFY